MKAARLTGVCLFIALTCLFNTRSFGQNRSSGFIDSAAVVNSRINRSAFGLLISRSGSPMENDGSISKGSGAGQDWLNFQGMTLISCVGYLLDLAPGARLILNDSAKGDVRIDVMFHTKSVFDSSFAGKYLPGKPNMNYILYMLSKEFDFSIRFTNEPEFHYELITIDTAKGRTFTRASSDAGGLTISSYAEIFDGGIGMDKQDIHSVAKRLEALIHVPVTAFGDDTTKYKLSVKGRSIGEVNDQLFSYGLQLVDNSTERVWKAYVRFR